MTLRLICCTLLPFLFAGCASMSSPPRSIAPEVSTTSHQPRPYVQIQHPEWTKSATIYQINTRQFTPEGTFRAAQTQLPRLKQLGVEILWLMPIHPIGKVERKGSLGSPYSVQDYYGVNPEFGTLDDLRDFIDAAHGLGMHVILDWVANHSAWDNPLTTQHPDWYKRDWKGDFRPTPWWDWSDIIELDYRQPGLRVWMAKALRYWVEEVGVDGYRADVAGFVPLDFWEDVRTELDMVKPVFLLAEWESRDLHARAFDATYAWSWWDALHKIAQGQADANALHIYYSWNENFYPKDALRMTFVSNHDKNAWEATEYEAFGPALNAAIVLSFVGEGIPMLYNGQEAGNRRRLAFFKRDPISWRDDPQGELYRQLIALRKSNSALWSGAWGPTMIHVPSDAPGKVLSFVRRNDNDAVFAVFNFSEKARELGFKETLHHGQWRDAFSGEAMEFGVDSRMTLPAWGYRVLVR